MSFSHDPTNGAVLYGADGEVIWSSAREQAYWTDYVTGTFSVGAISAGDTGFISSQTIDVADVSPNATDLMGWFTATSSALMGVVSGGVHQLGGTTLLRMMHTNTGSTPGMYPDGLDPRYMTYSTSTRHNYHGGVFLSTYVTGGKFRAHIYRSSAGTFAWPAMTIRYWAFALTFDN